MRAMEAEERFRAILADARVEDGRVVGDMVLELPS